MTYDYIIVGAGSAGCVLANRLSRNPANRVLLLEAGGRDWNPFIHMPAGLAKLSQFSASNWQYYTEPEKALANRRLYWPRGRVLGGSSSINAMCYIRGQAEDYNDWERAGNPGWNFDSMLHYFKRSEDQARGADQWHGQGGHLHVEDLRYHNPLSDHFIEAATQCGHVPNDDFNAGEQAGFGFYQVTQKRGRRWSTAAGYLRDARQRNNLNVLTHAQTHRLLLDGKTVTGVEYYRHGRVHRAQAGEVLLCGGAINSPHLLMLSGIGAPAALAEHDIAVQHELPGVGQNLQDHLDICLLDRCRSDITYDKTNDLMIGLNYWLLRRGIGTSNIAEAGGFASSSLATPGRPDLQFHFVPAQLDDHGRHRLPGYGYTLHVCGLRPESRGEIRLHSSDPTQPPAIAPNYLSTEHDREVLLQGLEQARDIFAAPALAPFRKRELMPGDDCQSRDSMMRYIERKAETIYHPVGTCRMGNDDDAVVDAQLRVQGLSGLRVVDASIMPKLISGNTNAPTVAIAEKAADMILDQAARSEVAA